MAAYTKSGDGIRSRRVDGFTNDQAMAAMKTEAARLLDLGWQVVGRTMNSVEMSDLCGNGRDLVAYLD